MLLADLAQLDQVAVGIVQEGAHLMPPPPDGRRCEERGTLRGEPRLHRATVRDLHDEPFDFLTWFEFAATDVRAQPYSVLAQRAA